MLRLIKGMTVLLFLGALALLTNATLVHAAGMWVEPSSGSRDTTFVVGADGFYKGESVATWVTLPNLSTVGLERIRADTGGRIAFSIKIQSNWPAGEFIAVAHGLSSQRESFVKFNVGAPPREPAPAPQPQPLPNPVGLTLYYQGEGYARNERVATWFHFPNGQAQALPDVYADGAGKVTFPFTVQRNWPYGGYHISAQGAQTRHVTYNTFSYFGTITDHRGNLAGGGDTSFPNWKAEYFNNQTLSGSPVVTVNNVAINFDWGEGRPVSGVPSDYFSVRWTRSQYFDAGTYRFTATTDDGMRVWVGGTLLIDEWYDQQPTTHTADIFLSAGTYPIRVEYYEKSGGAVARMGWAPAPAGQAWTGYYFNNMNLSGNAALIRRDANLDFDWGEGVPGPGIRADKFSVKWDSVQYASYSGDYTVYATADDGVRVWIDGHLKIDQWHDQQATTYGATMYLAAGWHNVHVEYYENKGGAVIRVRLVPGR